LYGLYPAREHLNTKVTTHLHGISWLCTIYITLEHTTQQLASYSNNQYMYIYMPTTFHSTLYTTKFVYYYYY